MDHSDQTPPRRDSSEEHPDPNGSPARVQISIDVTGDGSVRVSVEALDGDGHPLPDQAVDIALPSGARSQAVPGGRMPPGSVRAGEAAHPFRKSLAWIGHQVPSIWARARDAVQSRELTLASALFVLSLAVYLGVRLVGLADYPIYFFTDEAVQTVLAADLVRDNFFDYEKVFLPTYFKNGPQYNLSLSVYLQVLPYLFFGKSVFVTRAVSVLVTLMAAAAVGLALRDIYQVPHWWSGTLLLSMAPAWFLHSRTAFETVLAVSLYAGFVYAYLLYRHRSPRYLYAAVVLAGLTFYAYSPAQVYVALTAILLGLSDAGYHWRQRRVVLRALGVMALMALPYVRFRLTHGEAPLEHLRNLGSYWLQPLPFREKLVRYGREYLYGLSPGYWFIPNDRDLPRHMMDSYGHLMRPTLPFAFAGLLVSLRRVRQPAYRALLLVSLVAPTGAAIVEVGITRLLVFVIPATLLIALGLAWGLAWLERWRVPRAALAVGLFALLAGANLLLLRDALLNGPTWHQDYGLGGMQYGARQVFPAVTRYLAEKPDTRVVLSPTWSNGTDVVARFFVPDPLPFELASIDAYMLEIRDLDEKTLFVLPVEEYQRALASGKFTKPQVERVIPYPNGQPGFYFVRLQYTEDIEAILAAERAERARLQEADLPVDGQLVRARYSLLDMGQIENVFDRDPATVARTLEANPMVIELALPEPRWLEGFDIIIGASQVAITARLWETPDSTPLEFQRQFQGSVEQPQAAFDFGRRVRAQVLRVEVLDTTQMEWGHVHVWELRLR